MYVDDSLDANVHHQQRFWGEVQSELARNAEAEVCRQCSASFLKIIDMQPRRLTFDEYTGIKEQRKYIKYGAEGQTAKAVAHDSDSDSDGDPDWSRDKKCRMEGSCCNVLFLLLCCTAAVVNRVQTTHTTHNTFHTQAPTSLPPSLACALPRPDKKREESWKWTRPASIPRRLLPSTDAKRIRRNWKNMLCMCLTVVGLVAVCPITLWKFDFQVQVEHFGPR